MNFTGKQILLSIQTKHAKSKGGAYLQLAHEGVHVLNQIDGYPDTLSLQMYARIQEPGSRPIFELEPTDHPLSQEHRQGITAERVKEIMASRLKGE
jgi:hypothetical protein